jgi:acyl carrier protein
MLKRKEVLIKVYSAVRQVIPRKMELEERHSFVSDLSFDSLRMATLSVALEGEFDCALLLNDWIAGAHNPTDLSIRSLTDYLVKILEEGR